MILAGDIGGTKTVLGLFEIEAESVRLVREQVFASREHEKFGELLAQFLRGLTPPRAACFGVAGAVVEGVSHPTNLPWELDERQLSQACRIRRVKLLNDLEAAAYGMLHLIAGELVVLNEGATPRRKGNVAVIAAGTGLGEAILHWDHGRWYPLASEGGHADFAPRTGLEIALLRYLQGENEEHVSYERVLSGPGFTNIYMFLRDCGHFSEPAWLNQKLAGVADPNAIITEEALAGRDPLCSATLEIFCSIYGAEAGNLALRGTAVGGVFVGGGIAPKILPALRAGGFMQAFTSKGRFVDYLRALPVMVALNPRTPLLGAAHYARGLAEQAN